MVRRFSILQTPPLYFLNPPTIFGYYICSALSPPSTHLLLLYSFFFPFSISSWTPATLQTRAKTHTHKSSYSNRLFWERSTSHDWLSLVPHQLGAFNHPCKAASCYKCNLYGLRICLSNGQTPWNWSISDIRTATMQIEKMVIISGRGRSRTAQNKSS